MNPFQNMYPFQNTNLLQDTNLFGGTNLFQDANLFRLLKDAYEAEAYEDGWAYLSSVGSQLTKLSSSFDPRNYGFQKLRELICATGWYEVSETPTGQSSGSTHVEIRLKPECYGVVGVVRG